MCLSVFFSFVFFFCKVDSATPLIWTIFTLKAVLALLAASLFAHTPQPSHQPPSFTPKLSSWKRGRRSWHSSPPPPFFLCWWHRSSNNERFVHPIIKRSRGFFPPLFRFWGRVTEHLKPHTVWNALSETLRLFYSAPTLVPLQLDKPGRRKHKYKAFVSKLHAAFLPLHFGDINIFPILEIQNTGLSQWVCFKPEDPRPAWNHWMVSTSVCCELAQSSNLYGWEVKPRCNSSNGHLRLWSKSSHSQQTLMLKRPT